MELEKTPKNLENKSLCSKSDGAGSIMGQWMAACDTTSSMSSMRLLPSDSGLCYVLGRAAGYNLYG